MAETKLATYEHIDVVRRLLRILGTELIRRGEDHDRSKLSDEEAPTFAEFTPKLRESTFGSEEYEGFRRAMAPALEHHYKHNRHHPEHFADGIDGMDLVDLVEMFVDWMASSQRHADGNIYRSIDVCAERFGMQQQLARIFQNTAGRVRLLQQVTRNTEGDVPIIHRREYGPSEFYELGVHDCSFDSSSAETVGKNADSPRLWPDLEPGPDLYEYRRGYRDAARLLFGPNWQERIYPPTEAVRG